MQTVTVDILDDSKFTFFLDVLREFRFIRIAPSQAASTGVKTMQTLPPSISRPRTAKTFTKYSRDELHAR